LQKLQSQLVYKRLTTAYIHKSSFALGNTTKTNKSIYKYPMNTSNFMKSMITLLFLILNSLHWVIFISGELQ
jgi:hypothetical protein